MLPLIHSPLHSIRFHLLFVGLSVCLCLCLLSVDLFVCLLDSSVQQGPLAGQQIDEMYSVNAETEPEGDRQMKRNEYDLKSDFKSGISKRFICVWKTYGRVRQTFNEVTASKFELRRF